MSMKKYLLALVYLIIEAKREEIKFLLMRRDKEP